MVFPTKFVDNIRTDFLQQLLNVVRVKLLLHFASQIEREYKFYCFEGRCSLDCLIFKIL